MPKSKYCSYHHNNIMITSSTTYTKLVIITFKVYIYLVLKEHSSSNGLLIQSIVYDTCMRVCTICVYFHLCVVSHIYLICVIYRCLQEAKILWGLCFSEHLVRFYPCTTSRAHVLLWCLQHQSRLNSLYVEV